MTTRFSVLACLMRKERSLISEVDKTVEYLKTALSKAWDGQTRSFLLSLLDEAETLGRSGKPNAAELERIKRGAHNFLGEGLKEASRRPVVMAHNTAYESGKAAAGVDFSLTQRDMNALELLKDQSLMWVRDAYENTIAEELHRALGEYFDSGMTRIEMADRLEALLEDKNRRRMLGYFDLLADHVTTRVTEMGHVSGYEDAGIEYVEVVAVLDERTTDICRHMHGRRIPVSALSSQRDLLLDAASRGDGNAAKRAQPMLSGKSAVNVLAMPKSNDIVASGVALPPYHFRCRTTTVAYFEPAEYWERAKQWAIDGEVPQKERPGLIGYARNARWGAHKAVWEKRNGGDGDKHATSFVHYMKHSPELRISSMAAYNEAAMNLISGGSRDVYLAIEQKEHPYPVLLFHNPKTRELVRVNVKGQHIATYYVIGDKQWKRLQSKHNIWLRLKGGLMKWIRSELS